MESNTTAPATIPPRRLATTPAVPAHAVAPAAPAVRPAVGSRLRPRGWLLAAAVLVAWPWLVSANAATGGGPATPAAASPHGEKAERAPAVTEGRAPRPAIPTDRPVRVAFLVVDGVYNTELTAPYDVFHHTPFHTAPAPGMEVFTVSPDGEPVTTFEGLVLQPHHGFDDVPPFDVLVVPSAEGSMGADLEDEGLIRWVREAGRKARWVVSLCDGAFVLAEAGLLEGHAATTFPKDYDAFAQRFPGLDLRINVSFVHDGRMLTSQGGVRSFDVAMYLVDLLYGDEVARKVGSGLLIPWPLDRDEHLPYSVVLRPAAE